MKNNKHRKLYYLIILVVTICILASFIFFFILEIGNQDEEQLINDLTNTIESMLGKNDSEEIYVSGLTLMNESSYQVLMNNEVGNRICELIEYSIENIEIYGKEATVLINIKSPDIFNMICQIVENKDVSDTESLLKELLIQLDYEYEIKEKNISCNLEYKDGNWYLIPNKDLSNMLSGNLYEYYANLGENTVDGLTGGMNNEK